MPSDMWDVSEGGGDLPEVTDVSKGSELRRPDHDKLRTGTTTFGTHESMAFSSATQSNTLGEFPSANRRLETVVSHDGLEEEDTSNSAQPSRIQHADNCATPGHGDPQPDSSGSVGRELGSETEQLREENARLRAELARLLDPPQPPFGERSDSSRRLSENECKSIMPEAVARQPAPQSMCSGESYTLLESGSRSRGGSKSRAISPMTSEPDDPGCDLDLRVQNVGSIREIGARLRALHSDPICGADDKFQTFLMRNFTAEATPTCKIRSPRSRFGSPTGSVRSAADSVDSPRTSPLARRVRATTREDIYSDPKDGGGARNPEPPNPLAMRSLSPEPVDEDDDLGPHNPLAMRSISPPKVQTVLKIRRWTRHPRRQRTQSDMLLQREAQARPRTRSEVRPPKQRPVSSSDEQPSGLRPRAPSDARAADAPRSVARAADDAPRRLRNCFVATLSQGSRSSGDHSDMVQASLSAGRRPPRAGFVNWIMDRVRTPKGESGAMSEPSSPRPATKAFSA